MILGYFEQDDHYLSKNKGEGRQVLTGYAATQEWLREIYTCKNEIKKYQVN